METKFTKGNWVANKKLHIQINPENPIETNTICAVYGSGIEAEANAKLIASAPDLLKLAEISLKVFEQMNISILAEQFKEIIKKATE